MAGISVLAFISLEGDIQKAKSKSSGNNDDNCDRQPGQKISLMSLYCLRALRLSSAAHHDFALFENGVKPAYTRSGRILHYILSYGQNEKAESADSNCNIVDITEQVSETIAKSGISNGTITVFNVGSTAGITTTEYELGLVNHDIAEAFEKIAPQNGCYKHEKTWHDDNGHAHVRASVLGPSLTIPVVDGQMTLGTWQQIVLVDFDTRPRTRTVICQIVGE